MIVVYTKTNEGCSNCKALKLRLPDAYEYKELADLPKQTREDLILLAAKKGITSVPFGVDEFGNFYSYRNLLEK